MLHNSYRVVPGVWIATFLAAAPAAAELLVRVDLQCETNNFGGYSGVEPDAEALSSAFGNDATSTNFWNSLDITGTTAAPGPFGLKDSTAPAGADVASFVVTSGSISCGSFSCNDCVREVEGDYWFLGGGDTSLRTWTISGLDPSAGYEFVGYGGLASGGRTVTITVDTDGDGDLGDETAMELGTGTIDVGLWPTVVPDATGRILGSWVNDTNTSQPAILPAWQLAEIGEPVSVEEETWSVIKGLYSKKRGALRIPRMGAVANSPRPLAVVDGAGRGKQPERRFEKCVQFVSSSSAFSSWGSRRMPSPTATAS